MAEQLPASIKAAWRIGTLITIFWWLVLCGLLGCAVLVWHWPNWVLWLGLGAMLLHVIIKLALIPYRYATWRYRITPTAVYLTEGAITRKETAIPISRIQNVTLEASPILRAYGLQAVQIQTASTADEIAGVTTATAAALRDQILTLAQEARDDEA
ncbi:PH domain-containing protein [Lacticaseibacillus daqingensis]|uniref:PH domain-containing protein n=1 Tax=Lacticaseibacillus daqingensis TaxID=2486014 RepID=UPI000F7B5E9F|nr:PH domain-containing protein [Lacticaseibacillus daqingensis]